MKILISQINSKVGAISDNYRKIVHIYNQYRNKVDLVVFPELVVTGYPPEDLLLSKSFVDHTLEIQSRIAELTSSFRAGILYGGISRDNAKLYNSAIYVNDGKRQNIVQKFLLPNYELFDEKRYFHSGERFQVINVKGKKCLILICEDLWSDNLIENVSGLEFEKIIILNASPYSVDKYRDRYGLSQLLYQNFKKEIIYVNLVGGQDNLVFDGRSFAINSHGKLQILLKSFEEDNAVIDDQDDDFIEYEENKRENIYLALLTGLRDYILKNGFSSILIGLSGGVDSALCAVLAADALGVENVHLVKMPSLYTSQESFDDAHKLISNIGCRNVSEIAINDIYGQFIKELKPNFQGKSEDITEENLQSRIRGMLLMALSNKLNHLVLSTSNKSESAVGYSTLYGDMCGAYSPLKDVYKTTLYDLCNWRNSNLPSNSKCDSLNVIPENIINKAPTAELKPDQKDSDNLPEYEILDAILKNLIEGRLSIDEIVSLGFAKQEVKKVSDLLFRSEYKRRQSAIGPKISNLSFDKDRRYPITNGYLNHFTH